MPARYLFGPVSDNSGSQKLGSLCQAGTGRAFDPTGTAGLAVRLTDSWSDIAARLPPDWRPDFVVLYLPYATIPPGLWTAPVPLVALAPDWNLLFHQYRHQAGRCELVLTDQPGVERFERLGYGQARAANLFGLDQTFLDQALPDGPRDIDILFVGNRHPAIQRERLAWLGRLAALGRRHRVVLASGVYGTPYRQLLQRTRIVFNRSIRGECKLRVFEAAAAGALLFQETGNREVSAYFQDRCECVYYNAENLEGLLDHYLEHEEERRAIAAAAQARAAEFSFARLWERTLQEVIEPALPQLREQAIQRLAWDRFQELSVRTWQALGDPRGDPFLASDLASAVAEKPDASLHNALGLACALPPEQSPAVAARHFERALACVPNSPLAGLNRAEALAAAGQSASALEQARQTLAELERGAPLDGAALDAGHYPLGFDVFRVEWERAAWTNAGQPAAEVQAKRTLLAWRLHALVASLNGDLTHFFEAAVLRPDLPATRAALGCALGRAGRPVQAAAHLRCAVTANPFDLAAARALYQALSEAGNEAGKRQLAEERRLLARAAPEAVPVEDWFGETVSTADDLVSLIIVCCNELTYTRMCLESVLRHNRPPCELVLVDNGSSDGTPAYLDEVRRRSGPARVQVLRNPINRGFAAACNQALAQARGRFLVFLNNDTVVTAGWLEGLLRHAAHDRVGLVGPVSNYAPPPQQVVVSYQGLDELDAFAARRLQEFAGRALPFPRLTGFCLLLRRATLDRVGTFDERFGLGFFEDDDLCLRAREAGFDLVVAQDVFIHHFGSRTFAGQGLDCQKLLAENFERFRVNWGPDKTAPYRQPQGPDQVTNRLPLSDASAAFAQTSSPETIPASTEASRSGYSRVSLCLIVKNEEDNLPACLDGAAELFDEIVVVDTGSSDKTKEIAAGLGAKVFDFPWVDSFAAARNESLRHAQGDWIFWLDADDRLDEVNRARLRQLLTELPAGNVGFVMKCLCLPDATNGTATVVDHLRLFRRRAEIRWEYRVHEQILPSIRRTGGEVRWTEVVIRHVGYQDAALRRKKLERDLRLLRLEDSDKPDDPFTLFNLGSVYQEMGQTAAALPLLQRSLERSQPTDSIVRKLYALIVQGFRQLGQRAQALAACQAGRSVYPQDAELLFQEGLLRREQGDRAGAEASLVQLLSGQEPAHFASVDTGLRGYKARHNLAVLYEEEGRHAEAEAQWQAALTERPDFVPGWLGLADLYLGQARWPDLQQVADRLSAQDLAPVDAAGLRSRAHLARREFAQARRHAEEAIARAPRALWPRVILSHVLLQEGADLVGAERALRAILEMAPDHAEAKNNLAVLLKQGRSAPE